MTLYKVLSHDGSAIMGRGSWPLPSVQGILRSGAVHYRPSEWMTVQGQLVPCANGLHLADGEFQLLTWLGPRIFEAEYDGERIDCDDKIVVRRARLLRETAWDDRAARLFACDCAERALPVWEGEYPTDERPRASIETARDFANGEATELQLDAAYKKCWIAADYGARGGPLRYARSAAIAAAVVSTQGAQYAVNSVRHAIWALSGKGADPTLREWEREDVEERIWQAERLRHYLEHGHRRVPA